MGCRSLCLLVLLSAVGAADTPPPATPLLARTLNDLGTACDHQGRVLEAERYYRQSIRTWEMLGGAGAEFAAALSNLATIYSRRGEFKPAVNLYRRALQFRIDPSDPKLIGIRNGLAVVLTRAREYAEAGSLLRESLAMAEQHFGPRTAEVAVTLNHLAVLCRERRQPAQALPLLERAISIWNPVLGSSPRGMIEPLNNLGAAHSDLGRYAEAADDLRRALEIAVERLPPLSPDSAAVMQNYACVLRKLKRTREARRLEARADQIRRQYNRENLGGSTIDIRNLAAFRPR